MKSSLIFSLIFVLLSGLSVFAQEEINISSLEVKRFARGMQSAVTFTATTSKESEIVYRDGDALPLPGAFGAEICYPCQGPQVFQTDIFGLRKFFNFELQVPDNNYMLNFYKTSSDAELIYLSPRDMVRRSGFIKTGAVNLSGRVEIVDSSSGELIAFDNDVVLAGEYLVRFSTPYLHHRPKPFNTIRIIDQSGTVIYSMFDNRSTK